MPVFASTGSPLLAWIGVAVFLCGALAALASTGRLARMIVVSTVAELGFALLGYGIGGVGAAGAAAHLVFQMAVRGVVACAAWRLIGGTGSGAIDTVGSGGRQPVAGAFFGFGLFAAVGYSPFGGGLGRDAILSAAAERGEWAIVVVAVVGLVISAAYAVVAFQRVCLAAPRHGGVSESAPAIALPLAAGFAAIAVGIGLWPEPSFARTAGLAGTALPGAHGAAWSLLSLVPSLGGVGLFVLGRVSPRGRDAAAVALAAATLALTWMSPEADATSRVFALTIAAAFLAVTLYSVGYMAHAANLGRYWLFLFLMNGSLLGLTTARDFGGFHLFWELMTWSSYLLVVHEQTEKSLKAGLVYFLMCVAGAQAMHLGILALHAETGSLDMLVVASRAADLAPLAGGLMLAGFLAGFAVKAGFVPVQQWLPLAHPAAPSPISAPLSGILTKAGLFGILKVFYVVFGAAAVARLGGAKFDFGLAIAALGCMTLIFGEVKALREPEAKRMLAYSTLAQVGEIGAVMGLGTSLAATAAMLHATNHAAMKSLLFLAVGAMIFRTGKRQVAEFAGLGRAMPITAGCAALAALALMGLPPFSGFVSKFLLVYAAAQAGQPVIAALILAGGLIGCVYYLRLVRLLFLTPYEGPAVAEAPATMLAAMLLLAAAIVIGGVAPQLQLGLIAPAVAEMTARGGMAVAALPNLTLAWPPEVAVAALGAVAVFALGRRSVLWSGRLAVAVLALAAVLVILRSAEYDRLSFWFALLVAAVGAGNMSHSVAYLAHGHAQPRFFAAFGLMVAGLLGLAASRDAFGFFGFWELMSSWPLYLAIAHEETVEARREAFKYFLFNTVGASLMFLGFALLGAGAGSFAFADAAAWLRDAPLAWTGPAVGLLLLGMVMKAAQLPFRIDWQMHPAAAPTPVSGYISAVLLKCGPFGILKLGALLGGGAMLARMGEVSGLPLPSYVIAAVAAATILYAGAMAVVQSGIKLLLIYSTVSQLGYVLLGIALGSDLGVAGGLMHLFNHMMLKNILFLGAGCIMAQLHVTSLDDLGGLGRRMPLTFGLFLFAGLSLAGLPPLNGFASKWLIFVAAFESGHYLLGAAAMIGSLFTLAAVLKFAHSAFLGTPSAAATKVREAPFAMLAPMAAMAAACAAVGVMPGLVLVPIAAIETELGLAPVAATWTGGLPGAGGWHPAVLTLLLLVLAVPMFAYLRAGRRSVTTTHAHGCGVADIPAAASHVAASQLFESADKAIRLVLHPRPEET